MGLYDKTYRQEEVMTQGIEDIQDGKEFALQVVDSQTCYDTKFDKKGIDIYSFIMYTFVKLRR